MMPPLTFEDDAMWLLMWGEDVPPAWPIDPPDAGVTAPVLTPLTPSPLKQELCFA